MNITRGIKWLLLAILIASGATRLTANEVRAFCGRIYTEDEFEPGRFRNISRPLTFRSLCTAFGVSSRDYRLYHEPGHTNLLTLSPRLGADTNLPTFVLLQTNGAPRYLRDWDGGPKIISSEYPLTNPASPAPLFNAFRGTALGRVTSYGTPSGLSGGTFFKVSGSSSRYILKFQFKIRPCRFPNGCP